MIIFLFSNNNIRIITSPAINNLTSVLSVLLSLLVTHHCLFPEEPHAPQIKRDDEQRQDVGGAFAGPFNEGEELKLLCEVHGGNFDQSQSKYY